MGADLAEERGAKSRKVVISESGPGLGRASATLFLNFKPGLKRRLRPRPFQAAKMFVTQLVR